MDKFVDWLADSETEQLTAADIFAVGFTIAKVTIDLEAATIVIIVTTFAIDIVARIAAAFAADTVTTITIAITAIVTTQSIVDGRDTDAFMLMPTDSTRQLLDSPIADSY